MLLLLLGLLLLLLLIRVIYLVWICRHTLAEVKTLGHGDGFHLGQPSGAAALRAASFLLFPLLTLARHAFGILLRPGEGEEEDDREAVVVVVGACASGKGGSGGLCAADEASWDTEGPSIAQRPLLLSIYQYLTQSIVLLKRLRHSRGKR